uniref:DNA repair protein REV1 n=1 Tax=Physcomitrium patens TaxID=3218 RepID=A0A7I4CIB7_PHYPA
MAGEEKEEESLKRKKVDNVPRGMAWGAQSFASARISSIREKDPSSVSDFGRYMAEKRRKLNVQYNEDSSNKLLNNATAAVAALHSKEGQIVVAEISTKSRIFNGISIWVDGFTVPTHQELRHLMLQYGGVFENYFRRELVTHIICSTLPDSKIKNPRSLSRGLPIVKPEWIVDSIAAGRVLSWAPYQLQRIALEHPNQRTLQSAYLNPKLDHCPLPLDWRDNYPTYSNMMDIDLEPRSELLALENVPTSDNQGPSSVQDGAVNFTLLEEDLKGIEVKADECSETENQGVLESHGKKDSVAIVDRSKRNTGAGYSDAAAAATHSTLGDDNFVQNYFKSSRLHFIGTWRNRYQSRYGSFNDNSEGQDQQVFRAKSGSDPAVIHIDMDCFFVAVVVRDRPELHDKPVAVCHSDSVRGSGEISSANYPARAFGVRAGMFVRDAKAKCPDLEIVPYNFEAYEQVADKAVSCDEAFLDVTDQGDPCQIASVIRSQIFEATRCTASAGVSKNKLLARLATRKAKPNGLYYIAPSEVEGFMDELAVEDLPGVGWTLKEKLKSHNLHKCSDLLRVSKDFLQREFGVKTGDMLWSYARGIDTREVQQAQIRKSIGAEVNWGVRFLVPEDAHRFLVTLSTEVATRLQTAAVKGRTITLKVKRRKEGSGEPSKFMGCGVCDNFSRSETVGYATDSQEILLRVAKQLFNSFAFDVRDVRGVGLQVTRLEAVGSGQSLKGGQGQQRALKSWLAPEISKVMLDESAPADRNSGNQTIIHRSTEPLKTEAGESIPVKSPALDVPKLPLNTSAQDNNDLHAAAESGMRNFIAPDTKDRIQVGRSSTKAAPPPTNLPPLSELDPSVLASLPPEILAEIREVYGELAAQPVVSSKPAKNYLSPVAVMKGAHKTKTSEVSNRVDRREDGIRRVLPLEPLTERGESSRPPSVRPEIVALPPASQLDPSVMSALPLSLRRELEQEYKRQQVKKPDKSTLRVSEPEKLCVERCSSTSLEDLWTGTPPKWVHMFKESQDAEFSNLCVLAEHMAGAVRPFSVVMLSVLPHLSNACSATVSQKVIQSCMELIKQYVQQMIACDLEEVCMIMRVLKRVAAKSQLWRVVEDLITPFVQGIVGECYGGHLKI